MLSVKSTLAINGISSGITGIALLAFTQPIAGLFGLSVTRVFTATGIFLVLFSIYVLYAALQKEIKPQQVRFITGLDMLWVVLSIMVTIGTWASISLLGSLVILAVAAWVGLMAYLQTARPTE